MLWVNLGKESHQIISCNTFKEDGKYQLWIERPTGKTKKIFESTNEAEVQEIKDAIDYAIKKGEPSLELA